VRNRREQEDSVTQIEPKGMERAAERAPRRPLPGLAYWLIAKNENGRVRVLTLYRCGEEVLPVFGHEEEAEMFLQVGCVVGDGWGVRESSAGELVSVLYGPCAEVKEVALDPLPEMVAGSTVGLVSLPRERFIEQSLRWSTPSRPERDPPDSTDQVWTPVLRGRVSLIGRASRAGSLPNTP
jgi:hypothetical protein